MEFLYVLQLESNKWYVGKTANFDRRYDEHKTGNGAVWTKLHRPVRVMEVRPLKDDYDENNTTKDYMKKYGIENVRGGIYRQVVLWKSLKTALEVEIRETTVVYPFKRGYGACFRCGRKGHWTPDCYASRHVNGYDLCD